MPLIRLKPKPFSWLFAISWAALLMHFLRVSLISFSLQLNPMHRTAVFFYGTFMSSRVLKEHGIECDLTLPAKLSGYRLSIRPRVNLHPQPDEAVYGGLAEVTHAELASHLRWFADNLWDQLPSLSSAGPAREWQLSACSLLSVLRHPRLAARSWLCASTR